MRVQNILLFVFFAGFGGCALEGPEIIEASSDVCAEAQQHIYQCTGVEPAPVASCDAHSANTVLSMNCGALTSSLTEGKADGGWFANMHCALGVLHFCTVPKCEETTNPLTEVDCLNAVGANGCAQCEYYDCMETKVQCGEDGYLAGYVGKYCKRFSSVTYPRMSEKGQAWMDGVRECLITNLDEGYYEGESCESIERRGIADHVTCYVDTGLCSLPISDWLGIVATIRVDDIPFMQAVTIGNTCLRQWFGG